MVIKLFLLQEHAAHGDSHCSVALTTSICKIIILFHFTNHLKMNCIYQRAGLIIYLSLYIHRNRIQTYIFVGYSEADHLSPYSAAACTWDYNYQNPQLDYTFTKVNLVKY